MKHCIKCCHCSKSSCSKLDLRWKFIYHEVSFSYLEYKLEFASRRYPASLHATFIFSFQAILHFEMQRMLRAMSELRNFIIEGKSRSICIALLSNWYEISALHLNLFRTLISLWMKRENKKEWWRVENLIEKKSYFFLNKLYFFIFLCGKNLQKF